MNKQYTSQDTLIAFDLHEVLVKPCYSKLLYYSVIKLPKKWLFIYSCWPPFWIRLIKARRKSKVPEIMFNDLCTYYPHLESIRSHFITMSNMQKLRPEMIHLIEQLKKRNYPIYLFSNIGPQTLKDLRSKLPLNDLLDEFFSPSEEDNFCHKPNSQFYEKFKKFVEKKLPKNKTIIFIDDKKINITSAKKAGLQAIRFKNSKKLKKDLASLC